MRLSHDGPSGEAWAETEFEGAPLGDARLPARLVESTSMLADGTKLNNATRPAFSGLQVIGSNQTKTEALGVLLHMTMAMTADGLPPGAMWCS